VIGRLLRNMLTLGLLLIVIGGGAAAWLYFRSDELLEAELLKQAEAIAPDCRITIGRANIDLLGRVRIFDLTVRLPDERRPALVIPETIITLDRQRFADQQQVLIEAIRISQPQVRIVRHADGRLNWSALKLVPPAASAQLPQIDIVHGHVDVLLERDAERPLSLPVEDVNLIARPASRMSFSVQASARTEITGAVAVQATVPTQLAAWSLDAEVQKLAVDANTLQLATLLQPALHQQLVAGQQWLIEKAPSVTGLRETPLTSAVTLTARIQLHAEQTDPATKPVFRGTATLLSGRIEHPALPTTLFDLQGQADVDSKGVKFQKISARNGQTTLAIDGEVPFGGGPAATVRVQGVPIDGALVTRLPAALQRHVESLALTGVVSGQIQVGLDSRGRPVWDIELSLASGSVRHERFPYPIRDVTGRLTWRGDVVEIAGQGRGNGIPVEGVGTIRNPGPVADADFFVKAANVPIDETLLTSFPPNIRPIVESLKLTGRGNALARIVRPEGPNQKYQIGVVAHLVEGAIQPQVFPLAITKLTGYVRWLGDRVTFEKLSGEHDGAMLTGAGFYDWKAAPGQLSLAVDGTNAAFDRALYTALPESLQDVWDSFAPQGRFDVATTIDWSPGHVPVVEVSKFDVLDAAVTMPDFPYPFQDVTGSFRYRENVVDINAFTARHDDTRVSGSGVAKCGVDGAVEIELSQLHVDDLSPSPALRRALPPTLRSVVDTLAPTGRFSFHGPVRMFNDRRRGGLVQADWDLQVLLAGAAFNVGLRVDDAHGRVKFAGRWTPQETMLSGRLDLDSLDILSNHQITQVRGPFVLRDGVLTAGAGGPQGDNGSRPEHLVGEAFQGDLSLDAIVDLRRESPDYRVHIELNGASLENYAQRHLRGYNNIRGLTNGWMELRGQGLLASGLTGEGQLQISPAALYELPVFLQMFQLPQFQPFNRAAFNYANFFFTIANERYNFEPIDLVGNTISLRGRGSVRFDGQVALNFYSMQPRNPVRIPALREIVGMVNNLSQGWLAVEVYGPMQAPMARVVPLPAVDTALQQFLKAFEPRPLEPPPPLFRGPPQATFAPQQPRR
jgi:hypothetical protein